MTAAARTALICSLFSLALLPGAPGCGGRTSLTSPVVRVDLRHKLPPRLQRLVSRRDDSLPCSMETTLQEQGAAQKFFISWHVLRDGSDRYITALSVEPDGETSGAHTPVASAAVGELRWEVKGDGKVGFVPLTLTWQATTGCAKVAAAAELVLRADDASCKIPEAPKGLLNPVK